MLDRIREDLGKVKNQVSREKMLEIAPVYILEKASENEHYERYLTEQLCTVLEHDDVFSSKSNAGLVFALDFGSTEMGLSVVQGFYDENGEFKNSLEQLLARRLFDYHISQGIVLIDVNWSKDILSDNMWWSQFFRQIRRYKKRFLFVFSVDKEHYALFNDYISREFFTRKAEIGVVNEENYTEWFIIGLNEYSISIDDAAKLKLEKIIENNVKDMNCAVLDLWQKEIIWYCLVKESRTVTEEYIFEDKLNEIITLFKKKSEKVSVGFGFSE